MMSWPKGNLVPLNANDRDKLVSAITTGSWDEIKDFCMQWAVHSKNPKVLELLEYRSDGLGKMLSAAYKDDLQTMQQLYFQGIKCNDDTFMAAFSNGNLEMMKWLHTVKAPMHEAVFEVETKGGLEAMKLLHSLGCPMSKEGNPYFIPACKGDLETMKWLHSIGCGMNKAISSYAAGSKNVEALEWLYNVGCPMSNEMCVFAAISGSIEILEWLKAHKFPMKAEAIQKAELYQRTEVVKWLRDNGCPEPVK
jgi:hypothetical protein